MSHTGVKARIWGKGSDHWIEVSGLKNPVTGAYGDGTATVTIVIEDTEGVQIMASVELDFDATPANGTYRKLLDKDAPAFVDGTEEYKGIVTAIFGGVERRKTIPILYHEDA